MRGRPIVLIDDICSSGGTLEAAIRLLSAHGGGPVDVAVAHALFSAEASRRLIMAGARRLISTDSCPHTTNTVPLAPLIARTLKDFPAWA